MVEELLDQYMEQMLKKKEEDGGNKFQEEYNSWIQNNEATAVNTQLNQTYDNNTEIYNIRNFNSEELYQNFYPDDTNSDDDTNDESD